MPEVNFQASTELVNVLQKSARMQKGIAEYYGWRLLLARHLAALMTELHALGHYMVDMKPQNMRFYPDVWYMAIVDTDGFSINGGRRYPADGFSDQYRPPESHHKVPQTLGLETDLFALATIVFQLLNNGLHPFQGIDHGKNPSAVQDKIFAKLYAYGLNAHPQISPSPASIHNFLEHETRLLFDRAFLSTTGRPGAREWRDHLDSLVKVLMQCKVSNDHGYFSKGCGLCALTKSSGQSATTQAVPPGPIIQLGPNALNLTIAPGASVSPARSLPSPYPVPGRWRRSLLRGLFLVAFCAAGYVGWQEYEAAPYGQQNEQYQAQETPKVTLDLVENAISIAAEFGRNHYRWQDRVENMLPRVQRTAKISTQAQAEYVDLVKNTRIMSTSPLLTSMPTCARYGESPSMGGATPRRRLSGPGSSNASPLRRRHCC